MIVPVILAGGTGSRLWPLSRSAYPKQLLSLVSTKTLLQDTILRSHVNTILNFWITYIIQPINVPVQLQISYSYQSL